ncbi:MAG: transglycosylase domain-containing protein, partial [Lachnospiraceae bacterium]|nr:transglycosylase domain-containing protein [Lachnospiraceae bacterium]
MDFGKKEIRKRLSNIGSEENRQKYRFFMFLVVLAVATFVMAVFAAAFLAVGSFAEIIRNTPPISSINSVEPTKNKSIIYASDGSIMQELVESGSNRISVDYEEFPQDLIDAVISIEDVRFFEHEGVDVKGIIRAIGVALTSGNLSEGASTITQQLIKNNIFEGGLETNTGDKLERKFQEQYLALQLERQLSKRTILQYYLNTINFGNNCLGAEVASRRYFNKHVSELDLAECTALVATTSSPARYDPIKNPENNQRRRLIILQYMLNNGFITQEEYASASSEDVYKRVQAVAATYTGVRTFSYFTDVVFEDVLSKLEKELGYSESEAYSLLYSGGLRIYSTQDPALQSIVDQEVNDPNNYLLSDYDGETHEVLYYSLSYALGIRTESGQEFYYNESNLRNYFADVLGVQSFSLIFESEEELRAKTTEFRDYILEATGGKIISESVIVTLEPQTSVVLMDQATGRVLAISGGRGDKNKIGSLTLNRATQSTRQPGSTFKILSTYAPALDLKGDTLGTTY